MLGTGNERMHPGAVVRRLPPSRFGVQQLLDGAWSGGPNSITSVRTASSAPLTAVKRDPIAETASSDCSSCSVRLQRLSRIVVVVVWSPKYPPPDRCCIVVNRNWKLTSSAPTAASSSGYMALIAASSGPIYKNHTEMSILASPLLHFDVVLIFR